MTEPRITDYSTERLEAYCLSKGLAFDHESMTDRMPQIKAMGLTEEQFENMMVYHIDAVAKMFDATNFSLAQRLFIAFHFLLKRKLKPLI